ncbi:MAG TPA: hypothetical protein VL966_17210 [Alphaproteobacteria bacterium]|nr:hypothetical protein [Alphaproteobacteria bacterium]
MLRGSPIASTLSDVRFSDAASLHLVDDAALLFDSAAQRLYAANQSSAFIWCCLEDGLSTADTASRLSDTFGVLRSAADDFVRDAVEQWAALGLMHDPAAAPGAPSTRPKASDDWRERVTGAFRVHSARTYRLLDTCVRIRFASADAEYALHPFLESLADAPVAGEEPVVLDVREHGTQRALCHAGRVIERWVDKDELVPVAKIALVTLALERSTDFGALHAAAVARRPGGPCVLVVGPSGSGKSTLTAALAARGFVALGDDTIALARDGFAARPVPFGICVKDGAWDLLGARVPALGGQPVHRRLDGKIVRYVVPERKFERDARFPVKAVVFPRRSPGVEPCLARLGRSDALRGLLAEFCPLGEPLTAAEVDGLARWACAIDGYEMRYAELDDGIRLIREILS